MDPPLNPPRPSTSRSWSSAARPHARPPDTVAVVFAPLSATVTTATLLGGEAEHRDMVLSDAEKESQSQIMVCVSRARSPQLVLDL